MSTDIITRPTRLDWRIASEEPTLDFDTFIGTAEVNAATAKMRLVQIADEIISVLAGDAQATVKVSVEIKADFPAGVTDQIKRAVSENAMILGFKNKTWE